ncbi:preprotein translocase subunit YidC [Candidatus Kinetoplastibacterium blastocrithidii TCC012E]|uniref:Membrane protein insertase YidC n=1 Tax=Candidatus Kinetoplastidibacterium blastocrithidiae TCC012E TaxID=1208922 RepID=M1M550_9PROT|nr:membrane protein insertase YidC [Candidatus Kinetoplastibacterium blastocrithidii]AFZ83355.1 preprotein translocase subunit YidC [Candidatus Kinetoplastibacterium blastocrithidii (ex Strigomonas culicis)]AGF50174.1 preprotein translocase subunit YidC [Candidatus Kinetoplastibacterium blastocrithidii TCC012E]
MDIKRTLLWIIFSCSILVLWNNWQNENLIKTNQEILLPESNNNNLQKHVPLLKDSKKETVKSYIDLAKKLMDDTVTVENDVLKITFSKTGAQIVKAELLKYTNQNDNKHTILLDINDNFLYTIQSGLLGKENIPNHNNKFNLLSNKKISDQNIEISFSCESGDVILIKTFILSMNSYAIKVNHKVINKNDKSINPHLYLQILRDSSEPTDSSSFYKTFNGVALYSEKEKFQKVSFKDISNNKAKYAKKSENGWIAMIQHYFATACIPSSNSNRNNEIVEVDNENKIFAARTIESLGQIEPDSYHENLSFLWIGPQDQKQMSEISKGLDLVVDYGVFTIIAKPLFNLMNWIFSLTKNWGWTIVLLTVFVKMIFFPLASKSYRSMARLKKISPRIQSIKEQCGDDTKRFNSSIIELYRKEKINPLGGCLPMIIQIPVFISLYWVLLSSVEMRGAPWIFWIKDLSATDPFMILPILMMITMVVQIKLNPSPPDPVQAKVMMIMPLVFGGMMFFFPSGLVLYWCINNILSIAQQWFITRETSRQ